MREAADHTGYIRAVVELIEQDARVARARTGTTDQLRWARVELHPHHTPGARPAPDHMVVLWDEERGWGWALVTGTRTGQVLRQGRTLAPRPEVVAEWVLGALHVPRGGRADEPLRLRADPNPELEQALAHPGGATSPERTVSGGA